MISLALCVVLSQQPNPYAGMAWNNALPSHLDAGVYQRIWSRVSNTASRPAPKAGFEKTDFKPVQPRSVAQALVSASKGVTAAQGKALVEGLNAGLDAFEQEARKHNVAYAVAFLLGVSLQVVNERVVTDADSEKLAQAVNDELAGSPQFKKLPAKQKQLLYETCIVVGALIGGRAAQGAEANDPEARAQARAMAQQALASFQGK